MGCLIVSGLLQALFGPLSGAVAYSEYSVVVTHFSFVRCAVQDLAFVALTLAFFLVAVGYVVVCDRLMK